MSAPAIHLPRHMNAASCFVDDHVEAGRGGRLAVLDAGDGATYTYADLLEHTNRAGNVLRGLGVRREERVMLLMLDSVELVSCFLGAIKIGAVPIPTNTLLTAADYELLLDDSRARVLVVSEALLPQIEPIRGHLRHLEEVVVVGRPSAPGDIAYAEAAAAASAELAPETMSKDDACFWLYSSGTTGFPKGAVHLQHDMLVAADLYAVNVLGIEKDDRCFSVAKLFFAYGLGNGLYFPLRVGASTVLCPDKPTPERVFQIVEDHEPTLFFSVPTGYAAMLADEEQRDRALRAVRRCVSAGESLPAALLERWKERFGVDILDGIGSTEILHIFISNRPGRIKAGSTGEIVPGYEARLVDEEGREVADGEAGDLLIKGDSTCALYWNRHEATKDTIEGHWIRTGDKYVRDEDGYFWHQGRADDMLKVGGIWVSPVEVEATLIEHSAVLECAVVGCTDDDGLVKPKAYITLADPSRADRGPEELVHELQAFVKERLARYKYPRWIEVVDALPKTATGKIQRYKLRR